MKKVALMLAFILLIGLVWSLEYASILSVSEDSNTVAIKDSTLYVASLIGVSIYNYSNERLELVNIININYQSVYNRVYSSGDYLIHYNTTNNDIRLYDITDSTNPIEITSLGLDYIHDCQLIDNYLIVKSDSIYVYNTMNFDLPPTQILTSPIKFKVIENRLFALRFYSESNTFILEDYSMSLPTEIDLIDSYELNDSGDYSVMAIQNERIFVREKDYLYVFAYSNGLELVETFGPLPPLDNDEYNISTIGNSSTLISADGYYWDISDVNNIVQYQNWRDDHYYYRSKPTMIGDHYIKPNKEYGLVIVDFSDIQNPEIIYDLNSYQNYVGIEIIDNTLLDVAYPKLKMFDLSVSENIQEIPENNNRDWNTYFYNFLSTEDKLLLVNEEDLTILNTENGVANPEFCSTVELGAIGQIATYDDYFYNVDGESLQMQITDISQPENPEIVGSVNVNEIMYAPISSYVVDHYLLLVNEFLRVSIYDLSNPVTPEHLSSFSCNTLQGTQHIANKAKFEVKDNILYASYINYLAVNQNYLSDIFVYDITDIQNWLLLNTITSDVEYSNDIEVVGDYLYSVSKEREAQIYMYQLDGLGGFSLLASYTSDICTQSQVTDFDVFNGKLYLCQEYVLSCFDILYYTENDSFEIVPSNEISAYNYPNPFNPETTISYELTNKGNVSVDIYNLKGQKVKTLFSESQEAGKHSLVWRGDNDAGKQVSSGTYLYRVKSSNDEIVKKMLMLK